jgi:Protein of unknown function (DUF2905)
MDGIAKSLILTGCLLVLLGGLWYLTGGKIPLGRLPGDIRIESSHTKVFVPITTSIVLSIVFSLIMYLFRK